MKYITLSNSSSGSSSKVEFKLDINYYLSLSVTWLVFACLIVIVLIIVLLLLIFLVKRIRLAIQLIREASKAIAQMFVTLIFPVVPMLLQLGFLAYFISVAVVLASSGKALFRVTNSSSSNSSFNLSAAIGSLCDPNNPVYGGMCKYYNFGNDPSDIYNTLIGFLYQYQFLPQLYNLFMFFWVQSFIVGLNQMILAGSFGTWYWSKAHAHCSLFVSIKDAIVYHMGSIAFGNLC
jgi:choline transporter-like protein 2/4/5